MNTENPEMHLQRAPTLAQRRALQAASPEAGEHVWPGRHTEVSEDEWHFADAAPRPAAAVGRAGRPCRRSSIDGRGDASQLAHYGESHHQGAQLRR